MDKKGTIIITGASKGLGRELATTAYSDGFSLALIARNENELIDLQKQLSINIECDKKVTIHPVDLTDEVALAKVFNKIEEEHPKIRALINNAGTWTGRKKVEELSKNEIQFSLDQNFYSAFYTTRELLTIHRKRKSMCDLSILFIGATSSLRGRSSVGAFCIGKVATRTLAQTLAREVGPEGIHVAHLVIDGLLDNERTKRLSSNLSPDKFMKQKEVSKSILNVVLQDRSCWTFEWDLRPFNESW